MKLQLDVIYLMVILFAVVIAIGASIYIFTQLFNGLNNNPTFSGCTSCVTALSKGAQAQSVIPNLIVLMFFMAALASIILSAFIDSNPIFLMFIVITLPAEILLSFVFHDAFFQIASQSFIGTTLAAYPSITLLFQWLPVIAIIISTIIGIITFIR